jgi:glycosyltransferase involved in cell wall biosynthesis
MPDPRAGPPLRVRTLRRQNHFFRLGIDLGQRNAVFVSRPMTFRRFAPWAEAFAPVPEPGYDVVHSLNAVPLMTRRPYVLAFESYLPRVPEDTPKPWLERALRRRLLRDVRSGQCVAILPLSDFARRQFRHQSRNFAGADEIERAMQVSYPALPLRAGEPKGHSDRLRTLFVGVRFVGKGAPALVRAHAELRRAGIPIETTIVSSLDWTPDDYVGPPSDEYVRLQHAQIDQEGITYHRRVPNAEVLRLMREADYFVFPTLHDTFGYAPLEALSQGTPVIATDTCAQPEIVEDGVSGFLLPLETDEQVGKWIHLHQLARPDYTEVYEQTIRRLSDVLVERLTRCWDERSGYERLSAGALERVRQRFNVETRRLELEAVYERCREQLQRPSRRRRR